MMSPQTSFLVAALVVVAFGENLEYQTWSEGLDVIQQRERRLTGNASNDTKASNTSLSNTSTAPPSSTSSETSADPTNSSTGTTSSTPSGAIASGEVVAVQLELKTSEADATEVVNAFKATDSKEKVATGMKKAFASVMEGVTDADITIVDIKIDARRLSGPADATGGFLRRLNNTGLNTTGGTDTDVTLALDFDVKVPAGSSGDAIVKLATSIDTDTLKTAVKTNLETEAGLTVEVASITKPTASVKETTSTDLGTSAASSVVPPAASLLLLVLCAFFSNA